MKVLFCLCALCTWGSQGSQLASQRTAKMQALKTQDTQPVSDIAYSGACRKITSSGGDSIAVHMVQPAPKECSPLLNCCVEKITPHSRIATTLSRASASWSMRGSGWEVRWLTAFSQSSGWVNVIDFVCAHLRTLLSRCICGVCLLLRIRWSWSQPQEQDCKM